MRKSSLVGWLVGGSFLIVGISVAGIAGLATGLNPIESAHQQADSQRAHLRAEALQRAKQLPKNNQQAPVGGARLNLEAGILPGRTGPVSPAEFLVSNIWQSPVPGSGNRWYVVWAGVSRAADGSMTAPGVIVHTETVTPDGLSTIDQDLGTFDANGADGPLTVTSAAGTVVVLRTPKGAVFDFDLATMQFR